jgi:hypothetical protein
MIGRNEGDRMTIRRREFLGSLGTASIAAALPLSARGADAQGPVTSAWDMTWVDRVKGKYRAVFDSPEVSDGAGLFRAVIWSRQYKEVYGTPPQDMSAVLVVRHAAIWLAMNDDFWKTYAVGKRNRLKAADTGRWYDRNPIASAPPGGPPEFADMTIPKFIAGGGIVLACHLAFRDVTAVVKKDEKLTDDDAEKRARSAIIPGVILQPSGVFAVLRGQEAGCHYILAS